MGRDTLALARSLMRNRKFSKAIATLQNRSAIYERNFEYWLLLGVAYLYLGDAGSAWENFQAARKMKLTDVNLLLGQAAIFLRRGETDRAVQYYLDVQEYDPDNKIAKSALSFIRNNGDYVTICKWAETGKLEKFYPPIGINYWRIVRVTLAVVGVCAAAYIAMNYAVLFSPKIQTVGPRVDLSSIELSPEEIQHARDAGGLDSYRYNLSDREIVASYAAALSSLQSYRDNAAVIEVNRILGSNATQDIKQKARVILDYVSDPTFDTLTDVPTYVDVESDPLLYLGCHVSWVGHVTNVQIDEKGYSCNLLVGSDNMERIDGIVPLHFATLPDIVGNRPVSVLAQIVVENDRLQLEGKAWYQSVKDALTTQ